MAKENGAPHPDTARHYDQITLSAFIRAVESWKGTRWAWGENATLKVRADFIADTENVPDVHHYLDRHSLFHRHILAGRSHAEAIALLTNALDETARMFEDNQLIIAQVNLLRTLGYVYLHREMDLAYPPDQEEERKVDLLNGGLCFLKVDELVGSMTEEGRNAILQVTARLGFTDLAGAITMIGAGGDA